ncbi:hypothetical protein [Armatimonas rosea]|uniref:Uncharacterized protein n=1 Tax=Armatimonas rosea TaxID=685828 RepID=A0A7W9SSY7_ARMRO|nr:hypothetical protein [Armatimonas rosea]MBB6052295.1 hypothetical protein [Armatimonas rosea]
MTQGARVSVLGGVLLPGLARPRAAFVGNSVVVVSAFSHQPPGKQVAETNKELSRVMEGVFAELLRRAKDASVQ